MTGFSYIRANSVNEAVALLNEPGLKSRPLAGSTDLILQLRYNPELCNRVVDISLIPELRRIGCQGDFVTIGAAATFSEVLENPLVIATAPVLVQACRQVGATQIRNMGTLGGNVANAAACADSLPALICLDAVARVISIQGEQELPVSEFVVGPNRTILPAGGLLVSLSYRMPLPGSRSAFLKLGRRNAMAISRLTVAALSRLAPDGTIAEARLVTGSATPHIARLQVVEEYLVGKKPSAELYASAAKLAADEMVRQAGWRWSSEFKVPALTAMVARALRRVFVGEAEPLPSPPLKGREQNLSPALPSREGGKAPIHAAFVAEIGVPSSAPLSLRGGAGGEVLLPPSLEGRAGERFFLPSPSEGEGPGVRVGMPPTLQSEKDTNISFTLNGHPVQVTVSPDTSLLSVLRDHLGLTGTKEGCGIGECGACSVLLDGRLVNSCLTLAAQAAGRNVVTIEGVSNPGGSPSDLQQAFIQSGAVQCGFCTPGMILAGEAILSANPHPSRIEIREAIAGNLCRCTGYQQIVDAIQVTAAHRSGKENK
jgi:xanthine dehydrogenase iron-sulfur cluster and FAD-binding subunit A